MTSLTQPPARTRTVTPVIAVECDGLIGCWSPADGFTGDDPLVAHAEEAALGRYDVEWGHLPMQIAGDRDPRAALTALMYFRPGRTRILAWPEAVRSWWEDTAMRCEPGLDEIRV